MPICLALVGTGQLTLDTQRAEGAGTDNSGGVGAVPLRPGYEPSGEEIFRHFKCGTLVTQTRGLREGNTDLSYRP